MKSLLTIFFLGVWLMPLSQAQDAQSAIVHIVAVQKWEYRLLDSSEEVATLQKQVGLDPTQLIVGVEPVKRFEAARLARLNALGEEGWQICGCLDKDNATLVFRRLK